MILFLPILYKYKNSDEKDDLTFDRSFNIQLSV